MESFLFEQVIFRVDFSLRLWTRRFNAPWWGLVSKSMTSQILGFDSSTNSDVRVHGFVPWGGARGQNLGHLRIFFSFLLGNHSCFNNMYYLVLTLTVTSTIGVKCPGVGHRVRSRTS